MYKLTGRKINKLKEQEKFQSFLAWEQYVCNKYKDYDDRMLLPMIEGVSEIESEIKGVVVFVVLIITFFLFICFISKLVAPIWENNVEEYFYKDYIGIIKKMRESKTIQLRATDI